MRATRRTFMIHAAAAASLAVTGRAAWAASEVQENDPQAQALGYRVDASHVDTAKYPRYKSGQHCGNCQYYQGSAADTTALCSLFGAKIVRGAGWCNAWQGRA